MDRNLTGRAHRDTHRGRPGPDAEAGCDRSGAARYRLRRPGPPLGGHPDQPRPEPDHEGVLFRIRRRGPGRLPEVGHRPPGPDGHLHPRRRRAGDRADPARRAHGGLSIRRRGQANRPHSARPLGSRVRLQRPGQSQQLHPAGSGRDEDGHPLHLQPRPAANQRGAPRRRRGRYRLRQRRPAVRVDPARGRHRHLRLQRSDRPARHGHRPRGRVPEPGL